MAIAASAEASLGRIMGKIALWMAYAGGLVLTGFAVSTVASIIGRAFLFAGLGPIKGDYELVEVGSAIAVFYFLPWCQLKRGHVTVDVFVANMPARVVAFLGFLGDLLVAAFAFIIMWRLYLGFGEKFPFFSDAWRETLSMGYRPFFPETTYELAIPVWIPFLLALFGAVMFFVVSVYTVWRSLNWVLAGQEMQP